MLETAIYDENDDNIEANEKCTSGKTKKRTTARIIRSVWFNKETEPEKHYRELIMLFTSWRNEETDLISNSSSYQQQYLLLAHSISEQMKQYAVYNDDLNQIEEQINDMEDFENDHYDLIAPAIQNVEYQDQAEGTQDLQPDFNENYNLSDDIGIPSVDMNQQPLILYELQDEEYRQMVQMLNKEQKEFFYHILHLIKTSDEPFYYFLSGGAGVGKSYLTKTLYQAALKYYNTRAGKAAFHIKANTIHSALGISTFHSLKNYITFDSSRLNTLRCKLGGIKLVFLDEISLVGSNMFHIQINNRLKGIKGCSLPFGGVCIIAIGDLFQLKPVMDSFIFKENQNLEYSILAPNLWQEHFKMFELHEIMRQRIANCLLKC